MEDLPIKPPKVIVTATKGGFWKQLGMIILATTISLSFTIVAAQLLEMRHRAKDRRLSAMMVMSNIEKFSRNLEEIADYMASNDTIATWLLNKPVEELELLPEEELDNLMSQQHRDLEEHGKCAVHRPSRAMLLGHEYGRGAMERLGDRSGRNHSRHQRPPGKSRGQFYAYKVHSL